MKVIKFYGNLLQENRLWISRISFWALLWTVFGAMTFIFWPDTQAQFLDFLRKAFEELSGGEFDIDFGSVWLIFRNNLVAAAVSLFLGIIFGLMPLISVALNFYLLGYLFSLFSFSEQAQFKFGGLLIFLLTVLPHGVVEIPAFLIAAAFGLRLGAFWLRKDKNAGILANLKNALKQALQIFPLVALLMFAAAVIEIFFTGNILNALF